MKKFIALLLVFSIMAISGNLFAKERKGAKLIIQKKDGLQVRGVLIAVKQNSLLLLERESGADVTVDIGDIRVIKIVKKSNARTGAGWGFLVGGAAGAMSGIGVGGDDADITALFCGAVLGVGGALIGTILGAVAGTDKTIQIEGKSDSEIQEILEYLRKKAKVKNFQ